MAFPEKVVVITSRPARARGLKRKKPDDEATLQVAPRAGAWIKTRYGGRGKREFVAPSTGAWIETLKKGLPTAKLSRAGM